MFIRERSRRKSSLNERPKRAVGPSRLDQLGDYLRSHRLAVIAVIVGLSAILRVGYFLELNAGPCIWQHRWDQSDMNYFDSWARQIVSGDLLCRNVDPPVHDWHKVLAKHYYGKHGDELAAFQKDGLAGDKVSDEAIKSLWRRWAGGRRFYQGPLYPYLIAMTYKIWPDVRAVFVWQMAVGILTNVLIYLVARKLFGDLTGALSGLMACLYSPMLNSELILLRETLVVFAAIAMVYLCILASERKTFLWWLLSGLAIGLSVMLKAHFGLFAVGSFVWLGIVCRRQWRALAIAAAGLALGLAAGIAPMVARNIAVGVGPITVATSSKPAFALWNAYEPDTASYRWRMKATAEIMSETGGRKSVVLPSMRTHPNVASYLGLLSDKFARAWQWYEFPDSANYYYYAMHSSILRVMPLTFFGLAPIGVIGLILAAGRAGRCGYLYLQVLTNLAALVLFQCVGRFRLPMAAALIPFAAFAVVSSAEWIVARRMWRLLGVMVAVAAIGLWTGRALPTDLPKIRLADLAVPYRLYYVPLIKEAMDANDWQKAADLAADIIKHRPKWLDEIGLSRLPKAPYEAAGAKWFADIYTFSAQIYRKADRRPDDAACDQRAEQLAAALAKIRPAGK